MCEFMVSKEAKILALSAFKIFNASVPLAPVLLYTYRLLYLKGPSLPRVAALCPTALLSQISTTLPVSFSMNFVHGLFILFSLTQ